MTNHTIEDPSQLSTKLAAASRSAPQARQFVSDALHSLGREACEDVACLLTTELVTNSVLHAHGEVDLRVIAGSGVVRIEVQDSSPVQPRTRSFGVDSATGRGMVLVEALSRAWGSDARADGKTVWFELSPEPEEA